MKKRLYLYGLLLLLGACAKETLDYSTWTVDLSTPLTLTDVHFINPDTGYASAGTLFTSGMVWQTLDGGKTWDTLRSYDRGVHNLTDDATFLIIGERGQAFHETPIGPAFAMQYIRYAALGRLSRLAQWG